MASLFTRQEALKAGLSDDRLRWRIKTGAYQRLEQGVYFKGSRIPTPFERRLAKAMRNGQCVKGELAAALHGFDGFNRPDDGLYSNVPRTEPFEILLAIAATTTDIKWEWALEWCLRHGHTTVDAVEQVLTVHRKGNGRIRRVLKLRPLNAPPTGSVLETMAVQLIRRIPNLPTPTRQVKVRRWYVDLAWPEQGVFLELDGEWHKGQPRYDATRQTAVVAATRWLVGRYTWTDIVHHPESTLRSINKLFEGDDAAKAS